MHVLITGSAGLIGSSVARFYCERGATVTGVDNDMRREFFGPQASTASVAAGLCSRYASYRHAYADIRDREALAPLFEKTRFDLIVHAAAQPSHDWAASQPFTDFSVNAVGTLQLLELTRTYSPDAVFVFLSTNKVYGDHPNALPLRESETRWDLAPDHPLFDGINESMSTDRCTHSVYGASKLSADVLTQEYAKSFGLKTCILRCSCVTGAAHAGVPLHGFLSHLVRVALRGETYVIIGYGGKQVRDNLHADDVATAIDAFRLRPNAGAVYNLGGGRSRSVSVLEALERTAAITSKTIKTAVNPQARRGDHLWYVTSTAAFERDYPAWRAGRTLDEIIEDIARNAPVPAKNFAFAVEH